MQGRGVRRRRGAKDNKQGFVAKWPGKIKFPQKQKPAATSLVLIHM